MREQGKPGKKKHTQKKEQKQTNLRMNKSKENTLICMDMDIPKHVRKTKIGQKAISYIGRSIQDRVNSLNTFKHNIKKYYLT